MPSNSATGAGSLEVVDASVPPNFLLKLNDRLRRISLALGNRSGQPTTVSSQTGTTASPGEVVLTVPGMLAIESDAAAALTLGASASFSQVVLLLKQAPQGGTVQVQLYVSGSAWGNPVSASGTSAMASAAGAIAKDARIRLDIISVGATFPGSDLTAILR